MGSFVIFKTHEDDPRYLSASEISFLQWQLLISIYMIFLFLGPKTPMDVEDNDVTEHHNVMSSSSTAEDIGKS